MRKFVSAIAMLLLLCFSASISFAQTYAFQSALPKTAMLGLMNLDDGVEMAAGTVAIDNNLKLQKSFNRQYKNANDVMWYPLNKDFLSKFDYNGRKTTALFTKKGHMVYSIAYSTEKDLPIDYRRTIKSMYIDFDILGAVEIHSAELKNAIWLVYLISDKHIVVTRFSDNGMDEFARYDNAPREPKKLRKGRIVIPKATKYNQ